MAQPRVVACRCGGCLIGRAGPPVGGVGVREVVEEGVSGVDGRRSLGRRFGWLWAAYAVSAFGTSLSFGAFPLIAVLVLHGGPAAVSALAAAGSGPAPELGLARHAAVAARPPGLAGVAGRARGGPAVGAAVAVPLGP